MKKTYFLCAWALTAALLLPQGAFAQALSAKGIGAGGNVVRAVVPEAGNIFTVIDQIQDLQQELVDCARQGLFFNGTTCRSANPPQVVFRRTSAETYVDVERAFPNTGIVTYPLDGEDGTLTLLD